MGANQASRTLHTSPVAAQATVRDSTSQQNETDAPLIPPSRLRGRGVVGGHKYLLSLDRNMKVFLRASNLPGLEYRLKLAGYRTFHDLLTTDRETLEAKGFTGIMAQRLMAAVIEYLNRQIHRSEEEQLPFRLVRKGQRLQTEPSESMRDNPNYRKWNVKRQKSSGDETTKKGPQGSVPLTSTQTPSHIRLMSKSDLQVQHLLSPPPQEPSQTLAPPSPPAAHSGESGTDRHREQLLPEDGSGRRIIAVIVDNEGSLVLEEPASLSEPPFQDLNTLLPEEEEQFPHSGLEQLEEETDFSSSSTVSWRFSRSFSVPADFELVTRDYSTAPGADDRVVTRIRTFSSPASMVRCVRPTTNAAHSQTTSTSTAVISASLGQSTEQGGRDSSVHGARGRMEVMGLEGEEFQEETGTESDIDVLIETLRHTGKVADLHCTLRRVLWIAKQSRGAVARASEKGVLGVVVDVLRRHSGVVAVANVCCQLIQQLYQGTCTVCTCICTCTYTVQGGKTNFISSEKIHIHTM